MLILVFVALRTTILTSLAIVRPVPAYCVKPGCHGRACPRYWQGSHRSCDKGGIIR
jgi:hypothetical protein